MSCDMQLKNVAKYTLLRKIGEGGFGEVFLAQKGVSYFALKLIPSDKSEREIKAFESYLKLAKRGNANLVEILDWGTHNDYFYYVMPLADPMGSSKSFAFEDVRWTEKSLSKLIEERTENPNADWFSKDEIISIISNIVDSADFINKNGFVHRDIKPSNVLFFGGEARLADFGLLQDDRRDVSRIGTAMYSAPAWYLNSGGNSDMYGVVATFYTLISGNYPESMGNPNYLMPQKTRNKVDKKFIEQYEHWHRCILRAVSGNPQDRFLSFQDFKSALLSSDFEESKRWSAGYSNSSRKRIALYILIAALTIIFTLLTFSHSIFTDADKIGIEKFLAAKNDEFVSTFRYGKVIPRSVKEPLEGPRFIMPYGAWLKNNYSRMLKDLKSYCADYEYAKRHLDEHKEYRISENVYMRVSGKTLIEGYSHIFKKYKALTKSPLFMYEYYYDRENSASSNDVCNFYFNTPQHSSDSLTNKTN